MYANIDVGCSPQEWESLLNALKRAYIMKSRLSGNDLPDLYLSGIRYKRERGERWQNPHETYNKRAGDCEDLALYRAVELCKRGINAFVRIYRTNSGGYHAIVEINPGIYEDPSRLLGMNSHSPFMGVETAIMPYSAPVTSPEMAIINAMPVDPATKAAMLASAPIARAGIKKFMSWKRRRAEKKRRARALARRNAARNDE
jgi:hypothetical protein